ncbi:YkgJ family cysteine cluster protein [Candidatus Mycobacterium methanotrophicum]|uniref:YkgJ family cysteine cluster protein n=1 Tax=Candidatus Mycobacterium methanotrophicum TaxID=2943498 RepID=A0ABY4QH36_9MYCO|nr:YkgJ family cysteine cluster protein [Candidatus Mycobacterium methanotrophicum]UQX09316.1 YkgJ family cysteine cluster protein [Candidatus Mycobacterium methanotrophicum]
MTTVRETLRRQLIAYSCSQNCMGVEGNAGGCCTLDDRDFIPGPVRDAETFLIDLRRVLGREVSRHEVFIDFDEGRTLFPDRPSWQLPANYPALRVRPDVEWIPCRFYDKTTNACTVYDIRPAMCRDFLCDHLKGVIALLNLREK